MNPISTPGMENIGPNIVWSFINKNPLRIIKTSQWLLPTVNSASAFFSMQHSKQLLPIEALPPRTIYSHDDIQREPLTCKTDHCPPLINVLTAIIHLKWSVSLWLSLLALSLTHSVPAVLASLFLQHTRNLPASGPLHWLLPLSRIFSISITS